jgi:hypothetical protein
MSGKHNDIIRCTTVEFNFNTAGDGFMLQQSAKDYVDSYLMPQLREVFDTLSDVKANFYIDYVPVEINITREDWQDHSVAKIKTELIHVLRLALAGDDRPGAAFRVSGDRRFFEILIYLLQHGVLPWRACIHSASELESEIETWLAHVNPTQFRDELARCLLREEAVLMRFINSFSPLVQEKIIHIFYDIPQTKWEGWRKDVASMLNVMKRRAVKNTVHHDGQRYVVIFFQHLLLSLRQHSWHFNDEVAVQAIRQFQQTILSEGKLSKEQFKGVVFVSDGFIRCQENILATGRKTKNVNPLTTMALENNRVTNTTESFFLAKSMAGVQSQKPVVNNLTDSHTYNPEKDTLSGRLTESPRYEGVYISNAGLVIVASFLPVLLKNLGLMERGKIAYFEKAVLLLHYLATGSTNAAEFQVALPKVLCGMEISTPLSLDVVLTQDMLSEADDLLASVITHWTILKNTSIDGLRESFLQRQGKLSFTRNDEWLLQVEQKPYDMLLQQLPWNMSFIKLAAMKYPLRTAWIA